MSESQATPKQGPATRIERTRWLREGDEWVRGMHVVEALLYHGQLHNFKEFHIQPALLLRLEIATNEKDVVQRLRNAWAKTFAQIAPLSVTLDEALVARYKDTAEEEELSQWVQSTLETVVLPLPNEEGKALWNTIEEKRVELGFKGLDKDRARVDFLLFQGPDAKVEYVGFCGRFDHGLLDGTGLCLCLDVFMSNIALCPDWPSQWPLQKAAPEPVLAQFLDVGDLQDVGPEQLQGLFEKLGKLHSSHPTAPTTQSDHCVASRQQRFCFSTSETQELLQATKELRATPKHQDLTISQLAVTAHLVPLLKRRPAKEGDTISTSVPINVRKMMGCPDPYFGPAFVMCYYFLNTNGWKSVLQGEAMDKGAAETLRDIALEVIRQTKDCIASHRESLTTFEGAFDVLFANASPQAKPASNSYCVSDGIMERYLRRKYEGAFDFSVEDCHLSVKMQAPGIAGRTYTFRDQLYLCFGFNDELWDGNDVHVMLEEWADALRCAVHGKSRQAA